MAMGGLDKVDFAFTDIRMELDSGKKNGNGDKTRLLLDGNISGRAKPGRMLAIMGPSGAGKVRAVETLPNKSQGKATRQHIWSERSIVSTLVDTQSPPPPLLFFA